MIYFIEASLAKRIKIGYSKESPMNRANEINGSQAPEELKLIHVATGDKSRESALHKLFSQYRQKGEWFDDCRPIRSFIACGSSDHPYDPDDVLIGSFFHTYASEPNDKGVLVKRHDSLGYQGYVSGKVNSHTYLVMYFSAWDGHPYAENIVDISDMKDWNIYQKKQDFDLFALNKGWETEYSYNEKWPEWK